jgi:hypothetical protein
MEIKLDMEEGKDQAERLKLNGCFGVGCAQFCPKNVYTQFDSFDDYIDQLKVSLGNIAAIQNLEIEASNNLKNFHNGLPTPYPKLSEGEFPFLNAGRGISLEISMRIVIPARTQRSILEIEDPEWQPFGEIHATISYQYYLPILIVSLENESGSTPSQCVRLFRVFLASEMDNNANCTFTIDFVGPTPFHADFYVYTKETTVDQTFQRIVTRGYDDLIFFLPKNSSQHDFEALLTGTLLEEINAFYFIIMQRHQIMDAWMQCYNNVVRFENDRQDWGTLRRIAAFFIPPFRVYESVSEIAQFRLTMMDATSSIQEHISQIAFIKESAIWKDIKHARKTFPKYDIDTLEKFVGYVDIYQGRNQLLMNTVAAAICGGVVSALITILSK